MDESPTENPRVASSILALATGIPRVSRPPSVTKSTDVQGDRYTDGTAERRCPQCWRFRPLTEFRGKKKPIVQRCTSCRKAYGSWGSKNHRKPNRAGERRGLGDRVLRVHWVASSKNRKHGGIPCSITSGATCPPSCGFFGAGCYAEFNLLSHWWRKVSQGGVLWRAFLKLVRALPAGTLWRHNEAGDLPGFGDELDVRALGSLVRANRGRRGFTFTHKPLKSARDRAAVKRANDWGFTINLSADSLADADRLAELAIAPVVVALPSDSPTRGVRTPAGRPVAICPAQTTDTTCAECQLCTRPKRTGIVGFLAHGQARPSVDRLLKLGKRPAEVSC